MGLGTIETLHGSPDARARGYVMGELDLVSSNTHSQDYSDGSDGGSVTVDGRRNLVYRKSGRVRPESLSQLFATNIVAAFMEHNLHTDVNTLIPAMMIKTEVVMLVLYDSEMDIWMTSDPVQIVEDGQNLASKSSILFI